MDTIIKGRSISLYDNNVKIKGEKTCVLTISEKYCKGSGTDGRTIKHYKTKKGWEIEGTCLLDINQFASIYTKISQGILANIKFSGSDINVSGHGYFTNISFAGQGRGVVEMSFRIKGEGEPTTISL